MTYNYSSKDNENSAKAVGVGLQISTKQSIEVTKFVRGKRVVDVKKILNEAIQLKQPIPFTRFTDGAGHKPGMGSGKFAPTTCKGILTIIESAESNAQYKGINTSNLVVAHISAQKGPGQWRYGRKRRQQMKSTHIEVIVEERVADKKDKKATPKKETKLTEKKPTKKTETKTNKKITAEKKEVKPTDKSADKKDADKKTVKDNSVEKENPKKEDKSTEKPIKKNPAEKKEAKPDVKKDAKEAPKKDPKIDGNDKK